jgi:hypothetical protein
MRVKEASRQEARQCKWVCHTLGGPAAFHDKGRELGQGHDGDPTYEVDGAVLHQTALGVAEGDGAIGDHAVLGRLAALAIETGRQINRENLGVGLLPQGVDPV